MTRRTAGPDRAVLGVVALLAMTVGAAAASQDPFGVAPAGGSLSESLPGPLAAFAPWIGARMAEAQRTLNVALAELRSGAPGAYWGLCAVAFVYGVIHAAGPGHGKIVIATYVLAARQTVARGIAIAFTAALVQSAVAIGLILGSIGLFRLTAGGVTHAATIMERTSFGLITAMGAWMLWRSARGHACAHHDHQGGGPSPREGGSGRKPKRGAAAMVLAVGLRPCSGALILLVFAASQGLVAPGIAAVLIMGLGTGLATASLALFAVYARSAALRIAGPGSPAADRLSRLIGIAGSTFVLALGMALLAGSLAAPA